MIESFLELTQCFCLKISTKKVKNHKIKQILLEWAHKQVIKAVVK